MCVAVQGQRLWHISQRRVSGKRADVWDEIRRRFLQKAEDFLELHISLHEEHHVVRSVIAGSEPQSVLTLEGAEQVGLAEDVSSERMIGKEQFLEVVEYQFRRAVLVTLDFVDDDLHLLVNLVLRIGAVENDVREQLYGSWEVFDEESTIYHGFLLVRIGVQVAAHMFHAVYDVPRVAFLRPLEHQMLHKVCHALLVVRLVACAGVDGKAAISHFRGVSGMDDPQPVGECMGVVYHCFFVHFDFMQQKYEKSYGYSSKNADICII